MIGGWPPEDRLLLSSVPNRIVPRRDRNGMNLSAIETGDPRYRETLQLLERAGQLFRASCCPKDFEPDGENPHKSLISKIVLL
jgi:hypothetical protein